MSSVWEQAFYKNIGTYISLINQSLESLFPLEPLENHIKVLGGYVFKSQEYKSSGVPVIRISDFNYERIDLSEAIFYEERKEFERFVLEEGDIIIAMTGGTIGKLAIVQEGFGKLYLNQRVGRFDILNKHEFEKEYVYWLARGVQDIIKKLAWGGAQPNVSSKQIEKLTFPFPGKAVQKNIISFLNDLKRNDLEDREYFNKKAEYLIYKAHVLQCRNFEAQAELQSQQVLLTQLRQAILQEAVQGKLTERWRMENVRVLGSNPSQPTAQQPETGADLLARIRAEKAELIQQGKLRKEKPLPPITDAEKPFELPENWVWCRLGEINNVSSGITLGKRYSAPLVDVPYLRVANVQRNFIDLRIVKFLTIPQSEADRYRLRANDILVNEGGDYDKVGRAAKWLGQIENCIHQNHLFKVQIIENNPDWVTMCINADHSRNHFLGSYVKTTNLASISSVTLRELPVPLPSLAEQQAIVAQVERLLEQVNALEAENKQQQAEVGRLMQAVLREAFAGKEVVEVIA